MFTLEHTLFFKNQMKNIYLISLLCFVFSGNIFAQKTYFKYEKDTSKIPQQIENLSKEILKKYSYTSDKKKYLNNLFRLQISAKQYNLGLQSLDSLRKVYAESYEYYNIIRIDYEVFSRIQKSNISSKDKFKKILDNILSKASETTKEESFYYLDLDLKKAQKSFKSKYKKTKTKDSISIEQAIKLIKSHLSFKIAKLIAKPSKIYIRNELNKKYIIKDSLFITTRDNANLSTIIVRKREDTKPLPVILQFSIYPSKYEVDAAKYSADYGYIGVNVNTRGKRYSNDELNPFEYDGKDIYDVIDWIVKQPWSNGEVGMYGGSYLGFAQWASTKNLHPALKTIVPMVAVGTGIDYPMHNNVFMSYMLRWIHYVENNKFTDEEVFASDKKWDSLYTNWYKKGLAFNKLDSLDKSPNKTFQKWLKHPSYDSYWKNMMPYKEDFSKIDIPILTFTGYYDDDQIGALHYYKEHRKYNSKADHYLVIGPYDHGGAQGYPSKILKGYKIDSIADIRHIPLTYKWFNHILKDSLKPKILKDKVNYQVMGTNEWKSKPLLKDVANDSLILYLDNTFTDKNYLLTKNRPKKRGFIKEEVNFLDRSFVEKVETIPEKILDTIIITKNKNTFISKPLLEDFEINGSFKGQLDLIINKKDLDIHIELFEVTQDGKYFSLSTFLGRASYSKNRSKRNLLKPHVKESIQIKNSSFTSKLIKKGSKLLLVLSVNKNPYWEINYGTGKDVSTETIKDGKIPLKIKWLNSSKINIPIFKYK